MIAALRFMIWNALLLARRPVQFICRVFMFLSLGTTLAGFVVIFAGTGSEQLDNDVPFISKLLALILMGVSYFFWSGISYLYDSAVFRLTPEGRTLTLFD